HRSQPSVRRFLKCRRPIDPKPAIRISGIDRILAWRHDVLVMRGSRSRRVQRGRACHHFVSGKYARIDGASAPAGSRRCFMPRLAGKLLVVGTLAFIPSHALAQASGPPAEGSLYTPLGHEVDFGIGGYDYAEPGDTSISIHGLKFAGG